METLDLIQIRPLIHGNFKNESIRRGEDYFWTWFDLNEEKLDQAFFDSNQDLEFLQFCWFAYSSLSSVEKFFINSNENQAVYREIFF